MKTKLYLLVCLIGMLVSCAEEGPFTLGKLESDIQVSMVTPTTAIVNVNIPETNDNLFDSRSCMVYLTTDPLSIHGSELIEGNPIKSNSDELGKGVSGYFFQNLNPDTQYQIVLSTKVSYDGDYDHKYYESYYPGDSFTTAKAGDYSSLGETTCELVGRTPDITCIKFQLPDGICFPAGQYGDEYKDLNAVRAYASKSPDMSNPVESMLKSSFASCPADVFYFKGLEDGEYYFQLKGSFYSSFNINSYRNYDWENITVNVANTIDLKVNDEDVDLQLDCNLAVKGVNFSIFRITIPQSLNIAQLSNRIENVTWSDHSMTESLESDYYYSGYLEDGNYYCYFSIPVGVETGQIYSFSILGNYSINGIYRKYECKLTYEYKDQHPIVSNPGFSDEFSGLDYMVLKFDYPSAIANLSSSKVKYLISDEKNFSSSYEEIIIADLEYAVVKSSENTIRYLRAESDFSIFGLNIKNGVVDIDGILDTVKEGERLFDVSFHKVEQGLEIIISCPKDFEIKQWVPLEYSCTSNSENNEFVFGGSLDYYGDDAIVDNKIIISVASEQTEKLKKNEDYLLTVSGINLIYNGKFYVNHNNYKFNIVWTYK